MSDVAENKPHLRRLFDGKLYELGGEIIIGRHADCNIVLDRERGASRKHARFEVVDENVFVTDLGSLNGTLVNGKEIEAQAQLASGDILIFDEDEYEVLIPTQAVEPDMDPNMTIIANRAEIGKRHLTQKPAIRRVDDEIVEAEATAEPIVEPVAEPIAEPVEASALDAPQPIAAEISPQPTPEVAAAVAEAKDAADSTQENAALAIDSPKQAVAPALDPIPEATAPTPEPAPVAAAPVPEPEPVPVPVAPATEPDLAPVAAALVPEPAPAPVPVAPAAEPEPTPVAAPAAPAPEPVSAPADAAAAAAPAVAAAAVAAAAPRPGAWANTSGVMNQAGRTMIAQQVVPGEASTSQVDPTSLTEPTLIVQTGENAGSLISLVGDRSEWSIGSGADRDLRVTQSGVSANHAAIVQEGKKWKVVDQMSVNGTFVNGNRTNISYINNADILRFGPVECMFVVPAGFVGAGAAAKSGKNTGKRIPLWMIALPIAILLVLGGAYFAYSTGLFSTANPAVTTGETTGVTTGTQ